MSPPRWPPILETRRVPLWIRMRDLVLTVAAWCLLIWRTRLGLGIALDYLCDLELTQYSSPDWPVIWAALGPFLGIAGILAAMIVARGRQRRHILARQFDAAQPAALALEAHAARWEVAPVEVLRWRELRVATVQFGARGEIAAIAAGPLRDDRPLHVA